MAKPFKLLRYYLAEADIDQSMLCELLKRSQPYITTRMMATAPWTLDDIYIMMREAHIPFEKMHEVFPYQGRRVSNG